MKNVRRGFVLFAMVLAMVAMVSLSGCSEAKEGKPELSSPTVSTPTIIDDGTLHVGVNTNNSPLAGLSNNKIIGIDVDIAAALADEMGLHLDLVDVGADPDSAIKDKKVDIVMGVEGGSSSKEYWTSEQYLPTGVALFVLENSTDAIPTADSNVKIAAQVSSKSAWAVTNSFGEGALESETDLSSAFNDLSSGKVDYVASDAVIGMYAANRQGVKVKILALLDNATGYCIAAAADNGELQEAVKSALESVKNSGMIDIIEQKWLNGTLNLSNVQKIEAKPQADQKPEEGAEGADAEGNASSASGGATASNTSSAGGAQSSAA